MNHYAKAIDALEKTGTDWRTVAVEVAKIAPSVLVQAVHNATVNWRAAIRPLLGDKIASIKKVRELTGMGLLEAKNAVEDEMQRVG